MTGPKKKFFRFLTHWLVWAVVGLLSLAVYIYSWTLFYNFIILPGAVPEKRGLQVFLFDRLEQKGVSSHSFVNDSEKLILEKPNTSLLAYGLWKVPQTGPYKIHLECDDFGSLNLDRLDVIQLTGINARNIGETEVRLEAGYHLIILRLFNGPGKGWLTLDSIGPQRSDSLLSGTSLIYLDLPNLNTWLTFVKGAEKLGLYLSFLSLMVLILLAFFHSELHRPEIESREKIFPFAQSHSEKNIALGAKKILLVSFFIIFILLGFCSQYHQYQEIIPPQNLRYFKDEITLSEERLFEIKPFLPSRGTVGFISDRDDGPADFYLTQYALAPRLVTKDSGPDLVVGIIYDPVFLQTADHLKDFRIIREFQGGLVLMERIRK